MPVQASSLHNESEAYIWWKVGFFKQTKTKRMSVLGLPDSYEDDGIVYAALKRQFKKLW